VTAPCASVTPEQSLYGLQLKGGQKRAAADDHEHRARVGTSTWPSLLGRSRPRQGTSWSFQDDKGLPAAATDRRWRKSVTAPAGRRARRGDRQAHDRGDKSSTRDQRHAEDPLEGRPFAVGSRIRVVVGSKVRTRWPCGSRRIPGRAALGSRGLNESARGGRGAAMRVRS